MKRNTYTKVMQGTAISGVLFMFAAAFAAGKKDQNDAVTPPNYNDSIAAFDAKYQPRIDSLHNKIRSAMSNEEIDYADFGELIKIDEMRKRLLQKRDSLAKQR